MRSYGRPVKNNIELPDKSKDKVFELGGKVITRHQWDRGP